LVSTADGLISPAAAYQHQHDALLGQRLRRLNGICGTNDSLVEEYAPPRAERRDSNFDQASCELRAQRFASSDFQAILFELATTGGVARWSSAAEAVAKLDYSLPELSEASSSRLRPA
jgi:hypothetical protein